MSKWDKLLMRIHNMSTDLRFAELRKVLESYGYVMYAPRNGSSHYTFRKSLVVCQSLFQNMSQLNEYMSKWFGE